jgi:hypothetical protein
MGSFYTNITLRGPSQEQIVETLTQLRKRAYVSPTINGFTVICEQRCDTQEISILHSLATSLSARFKCPTLAILNHDDDVLWYGLYNQGRAVDEYDSTPGYFEGRSSRPEGGDANKLCELMGGRNTAKVKSILRKSSGGLRGYLFAAQRHEDLMRALGMPTFSVGLGYEYIERGELPPDLSRDTLKRTW